MCCLGFYALQCGVDQNDILDISTPDSLPKISLLRQSDGSWLLRHDVSVPMPSLDCNELMLINDNEDLPDSDREKQIATIFAAHDVEVKFV
jgi:hypothetical protein